MRYNLLNLEEFVVTVIASTYNKLKGQVQISLDFCIWVAVIIFPAGDTRTMNADAESEYFLFASVYLKWQKKKNIRNIS